MGNIRCLFRFYFVEHRRNMQLAHHKICCSFCKERRETFDTTFVVCFEGWIIGETYKVFNDKNVDAVHTTNCITSFVLFTHTVFNEDSSCIVIPFFWQNVFNFAFLKFLYSFFFLSLFRYCLLTIRLHACVCYWHVYLLYFYDIFFLAHSWKT